MSEYIEYELEDGISILVEVPDDLSSDLVKESSTLEKTAITAKKTFGDSLEGVRVQAKLLRKKLEDLRADEVEVKFSLKTTGELGNFAIGKVGVEANYEVTLKWKNTTSKDDTSIKK